MKNAIDIAKSMDANPTLQQVHEAIEKNTGWNTAIEGAGSVYEGIDTRQFKTLDELADVAESDPALAMHVCCQRIFTNSETDEDWVLSSLLADVLLHGGAAAECLLNPAFQKALAVLHAASAGCIDADEGI